MEANIILTTYILMINILNFYHMSLWHYLIIITNKHIQGWQDKLQHGLSESFFHFKTQSFQECCWALRAISGSVLELNKMPPSKHKVQKSQLSRLRDFDSSKGIVVVQIDQIIVSTF